MISIHIRRTMRHNKERTKEFGRLQTVGRGETRSKRLQERASRRQGQVGEDLSSLIVSISRSEDYRLAIRRNQPGIPFEVAEKAVVE